MEVTRDPITSNELLASLKVRGHESTIRKRRMQSQTLHPQEIPRRKQLLTKKNNLRHR